MKLPLIMELKAIKCPSFCIGQSYSKKKELQNQEIKTSNPSHHGASIPSILINPPNGYQKPIKGGSFQEEPVQKNPRKIPKIPGEIYAQRSSVTLKKLCCKKHHKVIKVPWGPPPKVSSPSIQHGLDAAFQPVYLVFYWI